LSDLESKLPAAPYRLGGPISALLTRVWVAIAAAQSSQVKFFDGGESAFHGCLIHQRENA
jgi:hypothetical protein